MSSTVTNDVPVLHAPADAVPSDTPAAAPAPEPPAPAAPETPPAPPTPPPVDPATAAMLQREGQIVAREQYVKQQEAEFERLRKLEAEIRSDPIAAATQNGATVDQWLQRFSQEGQPQAQQPSIPTEIEKKLQELDAFKTQQEQSAQQQQAQQFQQQTLSEIEKTLETNADLQVLKLAGLGGQVYSMMEQHAARTQQQFGQPQLLDTATAAKQVRDWAVPRLQAMVEGIADLPEFKDVFDRVIAKRSQAPQPPAPGTTSPTSITSVVASGTPAESEPSTPAERRAQAHARALALLRSGQNQQ